MAVASDPELVEIDRGAPSAPARPSVGGDLTRAVRIAAATHIDRDGRRRYRGKGTRGQSPRAAFDMKDIAFAIAELERGHRKFVATLAMKPGSRERNRAERDAAEHVRLAANFVDDILDRRRLFDLSRTWIVEGGQP